MLARFDRDMEALAAAELLIESANAPSITVAERAGYTREGMRRSAYLKQGRRADTLVYSMLPSDAHHRTGVRRG